MSLFNVIKFMQHFLWCSQTFCVGCIFTVQ